MSIFASTITPRIDLILWQKQFTMTKNRTKTSKSVWKLFATTKIQRKRQTPEKGSTDK